MTAVEFLVEKIKHLYIGNFEMTFLKEIEQAKEIEKERIQDAFIAGDYNGTFKTINAEQYYNEQFKNK